MRIVRVHHRKSTADELEHITREMYRRNKELAEINRTLSLLRAIDNLVLESHDSIKELCGHMAEVIVSSAEYPLVVFMGQTGSRSGMLEVYGWKAHTALAVEPDLLAGVRPTIHQSWFKSKEDAQFLSLLHLDDGRLADYLGCNLTEVKQLRQKLPLKSVYIIKLRARNRIVGVMVVGSLTSLSDFRETEADLLDRLGETLGIALDNRLLFEENQEILRQLQKTNAKLRELDKTKDEFISMASHQLRTPLTAVKGYLSMVLEGDVGPVKKAEKEMIKKAFDGAQRMVYLIGDMLNVSRLQTGKFVIENQPTNLANLVAGEITQLQETAEGHHIKLIYHKPDRFPVLNLDDNKIRQVVMNFLDNAIYYTPANGSITADLNSSDAEVQFTVTDTGIGIPAVVQHHLFSKFYRANNARKMRPDGTGLGLFMAKKVITAQGGAIIFKSTEGKGSTFGFSFPRHAMEIKNKKSIDKPTSQQASKKDKRLPCQKHERIIRNMVERSLNTFTVTPRKW